MPDPTEPVIIATFGTALGIFAVTATVRKLFGKNGSPAPEPEPLAADSPWLDSSLYQTPRQTAPPSGGPASQVATGYYRPLDLLGIGFIFMMFFSLVLASVRAPDEAKTALHPDGLLASIAFQFISAGIVTVFVISRVRPVDWLGLRWRAWPWVFLIAPTAVISMWVIFGALQALGFMDWIESLGVEAVQDTVKLLQKSSDPWILGLVGFAAIIAAPLCEEIVFRGYLYPVAKKFSGPWAAAICSALIFAAAHASLVALLPLFIFGCVLVFVYEKTGSLWAPVAVHCCFNSATILYQVIARYYDFPLEMTS